MRAEILELRQAAAERDRELRSQRAAARRQQELATARLDEAERRNTELADENEKLHKAKQLIEQLERSDAVTHKAVRSFIESDLTAMRAERRDAEALLVAEVRKWQDLAERLQAEQKEAVDANRSSVSNFEERLHSLRSEHEEAELSLSRCRRDVEASYTRVEEEARKQVVDAELQAAASQAVLLDLKRQLEGNAMERVADAHRVHRAEEAADASGAARGELQAQLADVSQQRIVHEQQALALERRLQQQESDASSKVRKLEESLEHAQALAAEERKKVKRETARKFAELQQRHVEAKEEAEESAAKAKTVERNLQGKLSTARQERQRTEGKLRSQLQEVRAEFHAEQASGTEAQELAAQWSMASREMESLGEASETAELECAELRETHARTLQTLGLEHHQATQALMHGLSEERAQAREDASLVVSSLEQRHTTQLSQLREQHVAELARLTEQAEKTQSELERRIWDEQLRATSGFTRLEQQLHAAESATAQTEERFEAVQRGRNELFEEYTEARLDAAGVMQQYEALLDALRKERDSADHQFHQIVRQAEEKQRRLGTLENDTAKAEGEDGLGVLAFSQPHLAHHDGHLTPGAASTPTWCSSAMSRMAMPVLGSPQSMSSPSRSPRFHFSSGHLSATALQADDKREGDGTDAVLRAMRRDRDVKKAQGLADEFSQVVQQLFLQHVWDHGDSEDEGGAKEASLPGQAQRIFKEVLALYEQACKGSAEDEIRLAASRERELSMRSDLHRADVRAEAAVADKAERWRTERRIVESRMVSLQDSLAASREEVAVGRERSMALTSALDTAEAAMSLVQREAERRLAALETRSAEDFQAFECEVADGEANIKAELHDLRRSLQRELITMHSDHDRLHRREYVLEQRLEQVSQDREELEAAGIAGHLGSVRDMKKLRAAHEEERELLLKEIQQFQDEKIALEQKIMDLDGGTMARMQEELEGLRKSEKESARIKADRRRAVQKLTAFEQAEAERLQKAEMDMSSRMKEPLSQLESANKSLKESLRTCREDKLKDKARADKALERLQRRAAELESEEAAAAKQVKSEARLFQRYTEEHSQQTSLARRSSAKLNLQLEEQSHKESHLSEELERAHLELELAGARLLASEEQSEIHASEAQAHALGQEASHSECRSLHGELTQSEYTLHRAAERVHQQETQIHRLVQQHQEALSESGSSKRAEAEVAEERMRRLRSVSEAVHMHLTPLLSEEQQESLAAASGEPDTADSSALEVLGAARSRIEALRKERSELRAAAQAQSRVSVQVRGRKRDEDGLKSELKQMETLQSEHAALKEEHERLRRRSKSRSASPPREKSEKVAKISNLQDRIVSLLRQNDELKKKLQEQQAARPPKPHVPGGAGAAVPLPIAVGQPQAPSASELNSTLRQKLRELQAAKGQAEAEIVDLRHQLVESTRPLKQTVDRLQSELWDQRQKSEADDEAKARRVQTMERRVRLLENKLRDRSDQHNLLLQEKEAVEEQLNIAAKQLEALLAEEHREGDLQRDLAGLSKQFEQLHAKHRMQLTTSEEQQRLLQKEQSVRRQLEAELREAAARKEEELTEASSRHDEQVTTMQESIRQLRANLDAKDRDLQDAVSQQASLACEASRLRGVNTKQSMAVSELAEELQTVQGELEVQRKLVAESRDDALPPQKLVRKLMDKQAALEKVADELRESKEALRQLQAQYQLQAAELKELRQTGPTGAASSSLGRGSGTTPRRLAMVTSASSLEDTFSVSSSFASDSEGIGQGGHPTAERRSSHTKDRRRQCLDPEADNAAVQVRTAQDDEVASESGCSASSTEWRFLESGDPALRRATAAAVVAHAAQAGFPGPAGQGGAVVPTSVEAIERDFGEFARSVGYQGEVGPLWAEAQAAARHVQLASSESASASAREPSPSYPESPPAMAALGVPQTSASLEAAAAAADVGAGTGVCASGGANGSRSGSPNGNNRTVASSASSGCGSGTEQGAEAVVSAVALGLTATAAERAAPSGGYPESPGRAGGWIASLELHPILEIDGDHSSHPISLSSDEEVSETAPPSSDVATASTEKPPSGGLPTAAREAFRRAEALCEQQQFAEAIAVFQHVVHVLAEAPEVPATVTAEVWAHMGVAKQSLDRVGEAIDCYFRAVSLDPTLHVCFANLATLHAYLHERDKALEYAKKALELDQHNVTYLQIRHHLENAPPDRLCRGNAGAAPAP